MDGRGLINLWSFPALGVPPSPQVGQLWSWALPGSLHPGGAQMVMGDGSVHFLSESTGNTILQDLTTIDNGEVVTVP